ncbi:MAG: hypothetical protein ACK5PF_03640, partial [bacterium]
DVAPSSFARSAQVEAEYERVEQGFDSVESRLSIGDVYDLELVAARDGQASLLLAIQRKANLESPAFTGNPLAPTRSQSSNDQSIATTAFVWGAIASVNATTGALVDVDVTTATYQVEVGQRVRLLGAMAQTITAPAYSDNARWGFKVCNGRTDNVVNWGGAKHENLSDPTTQLNAKYAAADVRGVNATYGWGFF